MAVASDTLWQNLSPLPTIMGNPTSPHQFVRSSRRVRMIHDGLMRIVQHPEPLRARNRRTVYPTIAERERAAAVGVFLSAPPLSPSLARSEAPWWRDGHVIREFVLWNMDVLMMMARLINNGRVDVRLPLGGVLSTVGEVFIESLDFALQNWRRRRREGF